MRFSPRKCSYASQYYLHPYYCFNLSTNHFKVISEFTSTPSNKMVGNNVNFQIYFLLNIHRCQYKKEVRVLFLWNITALFFSCTLAGYQCFSKQTVFNILLGNNRMPRWYENYNLVK